MLYELSSFLDINLFGYISVRAGVAFFLSFTLTLFIMPKYLAWAISKKANQPISKYVPAHEGKRHTPTMGGAVFLAATLIAALFTVDLSNPYILAGLLALFGFGLIGLKDDIGKVLAGDNLKGLTPRGKMGLQIIIATLSTSILLYTGFPTEFYVPFFKTPLFDMGYGAIVFWVLVFLATTNAVNLTDGLDGLATVPSIIALASLGRQLPVPAQEGARHVGDVLRHDVGHHGDDAASPHGHQGGVSVSSPDRKLSLSPQRTMSCVICSRFPVASFIPTMLGWSASCATVSGSMFTPVRPGML